MNNMEDSPPTKKYKMDEDTSDDDEDENLTYEQRREKNMRRNMDMFDIFGVNEAAQSLVNSIKESPLVKKSTPSRKKTQPINGLAPTRRSLRIANLPVNETLVPTKKDLLKNYELRSLEVSTNFKVDESDSESSEMSDVIPLPDDDSPFFDKLAAELAINETDKDFNTSDFNKFTKDIKSLIMTEPLHKVVQKRIYSLVIHPSETSLVIAAGDTNGSLGLFSRNNSDIKQYRVHNAPINCISFCSWDPFKLISTSHDGTTRCGDLAKRTFDVIYSSKLWAEGKVKTNTHCTWHTEYERNLLIANGSGRVDLIDPRTPNKINNSAQCHVRSVRTVHCHPLEKHHFLTASGVGEVSLWDVRYMTIESIEPVLQFEHPKALTSAFFSASGTKIVSTCNDNTIKIFNTSKLNADATKPVVQIDHDNHTGRWLSVFKAKWHPRRDDAFFVGSMLLPKKIQIFRADGRLLHNLESENMATYCPVIDVHPTQNIYVGGNSSGRLHIFNN